MRSGLGALEHPAVYRLLAPGPSSSAAIDPYRGLLQLRVRQNALEDVFLRGQVL